MPCTWRLQALLYLRNDRVWDGQSRGASAYRVLGCARQRSPRGRTRRCHPSVSLRVHHEVRVHDMSCRRITLDTPGNRAAMPDADTSTWTPLPEIAARVLAWAQGTRKVPHGKLVVVETSAGATAFSV